ncbi:MAG: hypothetical protein LBF87_03350 [Treponema sp.]|jgi:hypothetical protein|nr:hypothetical protein [Treponema sp.]
MKGHDFIPQADNAFLAWVRNFITILLANFTAWSILEADVTALQGLFATYETKLSVATSSNRGKVDVAEKNIAKQALMHAVRAFVKQHLAWNPAVSQSQQTLLGITVHDGVRTSIPKPQTRPEFNYKVLDIMRIQIDFNDQGNASRAIPYGYSGAVFFYTTAAAPVADYELLAKTALMTHSPWILELSPDAQGKVLSGAALWQNRKGEMGPWSEIHSIIVP